MARLWAGGNAMSSTADHARRTPVPLWSTGGASRSTQTPPGAALARTACEGIAGQISEHLARQRRRQARASGRAALEPVKPLPSFSASSSGAPEGDAPEPEQTFSSQSSEAPMLLSEADRHALEMLVEQKLVPSPKGTPFLTFTLGNLQWGISLHYLREALPHAPPATPLPFSPLWLHGLINLRGEPVGLVNLSELLVDPVSAANAVRLLGSGLPVVVAESEGVSLALLVHELGEVVFLEESQLCKLQAAEIRSLPAFAVEHLQAAWIPSEEAPPVLLLDLPRLMVSLLERLTAKEATGDR